MSQRKAKQARGGQQAPQPRTRGRWRTPRVLWLAAVAAVSAAVVGGILAARGTGPARPVSASGSRLQLAGTDPVTGERVSLASYAGKPIVLNVWASWCTGCRAEARDLARFERAHPEAQVIGLDTQDTDSAARSFYREFGWRHPSIRDPNGQMAARLGLQGLPTTIFLDARHRAVSRIIGATNRTGFEQGLRAARHTS